MIGKYMPADYISGLMQAERYKKARCVLEFCFCLEDEGPKTVRDWSDRWGVPKTTAWTWCKEFEKEIDNHYKKVGW